MTPDEPLLLLHGVTMSSSAWADVIPFLATYHPIIVPTAVGHRGGPPLVGKASIKFLTDETERLLDDHGLDRIHVSGNSMGGWIAIELARRGRALSVCAFSPAGFWPPGAPAKSEGPEKVRRIKRLMQIGRPVAPILLRSAYLRRRAMSAVAEHGERLTPTQAVGSVLDIAYCTAAEDLLTTAERVAPMDVLPCPMTLAWGARDKVLPPEVYGAVARELVPQARYVLLDGVGHVPMIDNPRLCAETILSTTDGGADTHHEGI